MKLIDGDALIERVHELYAKGAVDLSYYNIVKEAVQMQPKLDEKAVQNGMFLGKCFSTPLSDIVPVVRCKDCVHFKPVNVENRYFYCEEWDMDFYGAEYDPATYYCADGKRKEN